MFKYYSVTFVSVVLLTICIVNGQQILEDARVLPSDDGTFGFLYRTQDGIAHGAQKSADGTVRGRFTYTDPTGFKVNYNYNTAYVPPRSAPRAVAGNDDAIFKLRNNVRPNGRNNVPRSRYQDADNDETIE